MKGDQSLELLREALPYIRRFKEETFVIKLSGHVAASAEALFGIAEEIALLHQVGIRTVVVHGGGPQIHELGKRLGVPERIVSGRRVTDAETLELAKMVFAGKINTDVTAALTKARVPAVGLTGLDGPVVRACRRQVRSVFDEEAGREVEVDFGYVGDVLGIEPHLLDVLVFQGFVPVLCPLAGDEGGQVFNVNADTIASEIAKALGAAKLILLSDVDGVCLDPADPATKISVMDERQARQLAADGIFKRGMRPKMDTAVDAVAGGVGCIHVVNGLSRNVLLKEIFTDGGAGTMIVPAGVILSEAKDLEGVHP